MQMIINKINLFPNLPLNQDLNYFLEEMDALNLFLTHGLFYALQKCIPFLKNISPNIPRVVLRSSQKSYMM